MKYFKKISEEQEIIFENFHLTDLMLYKKNNRNKTICQHFGVFNLLKDKLREYGLDLFGVFERDGLTFRGVRMLQGFPLENEPILKQLYGFNNFKTHIQLRGFDDFAIAFDYDVDSGFCELQKHVYGSIKNRQEYFTLKVMLEDIDRLGYENVLK